MAHQVRDPPACARGRVAPVARPDPFGDTERRLHSTAIEGHELIDKHMRMVNVRLRYVNAYLCDVTSRPDLAAMLSRLARLTTDAELPVLARFDLTMWEYVVLLGLGEGPVRTQSALAEAIGADKTRIIDVLDNLQQRSLITREPDETDRRVRLVGLTATGRQTLHDSQAAIQDNEAVLLNVLPDGEQRRFLRNLERLYEAAPDILG